MKKHITMGILAHVDSGKTTLSEGLLYTAGAIRKLGRVDHKDAFLDTYELEKARGITIFSKQAIFEYEDKDFTILDTPGHTDFSPEMERTLQVLDLAVLLISASDGVTGQVRILWKLLEHYQVPTVIFVNKMDQTQEQPAQIADRIRKELSSSCVSFAEGIDSPQIQEELALCEEALLTGFFEGQAVTTADVQRLFSERKCFPIAFGSALKMEGVKELLDLITTYCISGKEDSVSNEFSARVFKISRDQSGNRLTHLKLFGGTLSVRDQLGDEKIDQIRLYSGEKFETVKTAEAGQICAVTGLSDTRPGQGLGALSGDQVSEILQPIFSCSVVLPEEVDTVVAYRQLKVLEEEEPMLLVSLNEASKQIEIKLMGEVQKDILKNLVKTRYGYDIEFGEGHIVYKETIASKAVGVGHFEPLRHYAEVHLLLEPAEPGSGISFDNLCRTDNLNLNWQRLILTHLGEKKHLGVLTGSEITDIKISLLTGRAHEKHTEGGDFRQATYRAVRQGLMQADSVLLEPVLEYRIDLPGDYVGRALSDIQRMNGTVGLPDMENGKSVLTGSVPAACLKDYARELSAYTHGEGHITTTLKGYEPCHNPEEVIEAIGYDPELDTENSPSSVFCSHGVGTIVPWDQVASYMHLESGVSISEDGQEAVTDLTDNIDMEALKAIQARNARNKSDDRSFDEIERELRATDNELKDIFERTYGTIKPRYDAKAEENRKRVAAPVKKYRAPKPYEEQKEYLLVDGYNVIYASDKLKELVAVDIKAARDSLVDELINFAGYRRENVILVFDAYKVKGGAEHMEKHGELTVIYTKEAETADQYIEKAAHEIGKKYRVTVATSDAIEQVIVLSGGALRMSAREFWAEIEHTKGVIRDHLE
ncbi:translation factor GTPase family protein [Butyrivibrio proteoclasticus]|uniref:translation factor GTPase family protein n=1 Tax=Butyrivibrio proteoclasticus TaxID=43305 RepID=UPI000556BBDD|nr:TetM/TetW/TetO/TetS family tetracycline resistance ribosomal protection protein [Butyrivibrio proteoclasticus]